MSRLEIIDDDSWQDLLAAPIALLVLGRRACVASAAWGEELEACLADGEPWPQVRFGYVALDQEELEAFKKANAWVEDVFELPTNLLYIQGRKKKTWLGGRVKRLAERLAFLGDGG